MNRIFCIKMGASEKRNEICEKYLNPCCEKPGIWLGFNEADEENIKKAINSELALGNEADKNTKEKCWECVDECTRHTVERNGKEIGHKEVTRARNIIRIVCMADEDDIFFTFHNGKLWWCHPKGNPGENIDFRKDMIDEESENYRQSDLIRYTTEWSDKSKNGKTLYEWAICGQLRRKQMVQGTMSELKGNDITLFKWTIGLEKCTGLGSFDEQLEKLKSQLCKAVRLLAPTDFEAFTDMVFTQSGLRRMGRSGSNMKAIDGEYQLPFNSINTKAFNKTGSTAKTIYVQIKAQLSKSELNKTIKSLYDFSPDTNGATIVIVFHTWENNKKNDERKAEAEIKEINNNYSNEKKIPSDWLNNIQFIDCRKLVDMWIEASGISWLKKTAYAAIE